MGLNISEKVGAVLAFIPFVSYFSGLIKAIVYYKRTKKEPINSVELDSLAEKSNKVSLRHLSKLEMNCNKKLWKASIAEMIPLVNVIVAIYSAFVLCELSEIRELRQKPGNSEANEKLLGMYGKKSFNDTKKDVLMLNIIEKVNANEGHIIDFCYGAMHREGFLPSADKLIKFARDQFEGAKQNHQARIEGTEDFIRRFQEESKQRLEDINNGITVFEVD